MNSESELIIREKTTAVIAFNLYLNSIQIDLSSVDHIVLQMIDSKNKVYRYSTEDATSLFINDPSTGSIYFYPPDETIFSYDRSPYKMYCWVYDTITQKYSVPSNGYNQITVLREY